MDAQESQIYTAVILASFVIGSAVLYFLYSVFRHHKKLLRIERENSKAQVELLEKDRSRIAADLHDDLAPMLVAVKMRINSFDLTDEKDIQRLDKTNETIDDIAKRMRAISFDLMPVTLQEKGLLVAVKEFITHVGNSSRLNIRLTADDFSIRLSEQKTIHIYRMLQEIIHNTVKHAEATSLVIAVNREKDYLVVASKDNGVGFDYKLKLNERKGLGLKSLLNRVRLLNAEMEMDSKPGKGTSISVRIPIADDYIVHKDQNTDS